MRHFLIAAQFLTRLPTPQVSLDDGDFAASMRWFPAVGLVVGAIVAGASWTGSQIDAWVGALAGLAAWVGITGALHLDGLADLADASGAAPMGRERILTVLADPHVGSFGAVAIAMQLIAKLVLLHAVIGVGMFAALLFVPAAARAGPLCWTLWLPSLHQGLAARFSGGISLRDVSFWLVVLGAAAFAVPALLCAPLVFAAWGWHVRRLVGGISGDGHGAGIEVAETVLLVALLVQARLA